MSNMSRRQFMNTLLGSAAVVAGAGLVGCGGSGSDASEAATSAGFSKKFVIATDTTFAPFEFTNDKGEFVGIDVDLLAAVSNAAGFDYDLQSLGFDAAVAALESGQADAVIAGMSITEARQKKYDFSDPYYDSYVCMAVKDGGSVAGYDDLKGQKVAAKTGTQGASCAESLKDEYGFEITYFDDSSMMYQDVITGNSVACFEDFPVMSYGIAQGNGLKVAEEEQDNFSTPYGFAVLKGNYPELISAFNAALKSLKDSGEYASICDKYLA